MKKRLLSLFLAVLMIVGMIPAQAFAVDAEGNTLYVGDQVGQYATLEEAYSAAEDGDTITLCKDVKLSTTLNITKNVTIDLGEYDIKSFGNVFEVAANGELLIKGSGTISGNNVVTVTGGKVTVESGNISANTYGMMVWSGNVTILGGTIHGRHTGIYYSSGNHGIYGGTVSGGTYGVNVAGGKCEITGGRFSHDPSQYVDKSAYSVTEQDGWFVVSSTGGTEPTPPASDYVAMVGEQGYETLQAAVNAAQSGDTIELLKDVELTAIVTVPAGKNITLDLGGQKIESSGYPVEGMFDTEAVLTVCGEVTIIDSGEGGKIFCNSDEVAFDSCGVYVLGGKLNIEGGTISGAADGNFIYGVMVASNGTANISGGKIEVTGNDAFAEGVGVVSPNSTANIFGGIIEATGISGYGVDANHGTANIFGGTISGNSYGVLNRVTVNIEGTANIKGGTFSGTIQNEGNGAIAISGGKFDKDPSEYVDKSAYSVTEQDGWYVVSAGGSTEPTPPEGEEQTKDYELVITKVQKAAKDGAGNMTFDAAAAETVSEAEIGDVLVVTLGIKNNTEDSIYPVNFNLKMYYDSEFVTPYKLWDNNTEIADPFGLKSTYMWGAEAKNDEYISIAAATSSKKGFEVDGETTKGIFYLAFQVNSDAAEGTAQFWFDQNEPQSEFNQNDGSGDDVSIDVYGGEAASVAISKPAYAAEVGGKGYMTLDAALAAVNEENNTVTLLKDIDLGNDSILIAKSLTLDMNGKKIESGSFALNIYNGVVTITDSGEGGTVSGSTYGVYANGGLVTITGGTITGASYGVYVDDGKCEISGGNISGASYGVYVYGSNAKANITGGTVSGFAGVLAQDGGTVNIENGTISGSTYGVYVYDGIANIEGGTVSGYDGVAVDGGECEISGGTVTATGDNGAGVLVLGGKLEISGGEVLGVYGVYVECNDGGNAEVTISNGTVSGSAYGVSVYDGTAYIKGGTVSGGTYGVYASGNGSEANIEGGNISSGLYGIYVSGSNAKANIKGGTVSGDYCVFVYDGTCVVTGGRFNKNPSQYVPDTHGVTTEDGWYVVSKVTRYNITVGTTVNGTVEVDKTSAKAGETVTVTVTPMPGYELTNLSYKKNGMSIGIMGNSFAMPTGDVEIVAIFKALPTYRIMMPSTFKGGTVTVDDTEAYAGQEVTVTAAANEGYELAFVSVMTAKGTQITLTDGKFTMPAEVVMIAAAFKEKVSYVAQVGEQKFESLQAAIDAAEDGDEIVLLSDITLTADDTMVIDGSIIGVFVTDKNIALDMNGKTISVDLTGMTGTIIPFATVRDGHLTINDTVGSGKITATGAKAYALFSAYNPASRLTINGGAFELAEAADCLIHANANEAVVVNGGTFTLDNVGTGNNYQPWIFNVNGKNASHVIVNGGTYNSDVNHQFWGNEVMVPETLAVKDNGDGTWTVTEAEAYIVEIGTSQHSAERKIGYATLADAIASVEKNAPETTIVLLKDVKVSGQYIGHSYAQKIVLDLNGKTLSSADRTLNIHRGGTEVLIKNGTVTGNTTAGTIQVSGGAKLTLENATIKSGSKAKAIKINKDGTLVINDASVKVQGGLDDLIVETGAKTLISAGTFNYDVSAYCVDEYGAVKNTDGTYTVKRVMLVENVTTGVKYKTVADAIKDIAKNAGVQELKLLGDVTVKGQFIGHSYAQQVVIDLNGFKMSSTDKALTVYRAGTEVTIKNGTVHGNSTGGTIQVTYGGKLTLGENVTITSGGSANALKVDPPATLIIDNDTVKVQGGKNDLIVADGAKVEISAGYFKHPVAEAWCAEGKMPNPVKTADGWYTVMDAGAAVINGKAYETLHDAFAAVKNGETIKVMKNIDLANEETVTLAEQYKTYFKVEGKSVTIDLNGKTISGTAGNADNMLVGVFSTENDGHLTITGEGTVDVQDGGKVYALIVNYEDGCSIVIENGTYKLDAASDSLIYCGAGYAEGTEGILVQDGIFHLGNLGKGPNGNGSPWIFNVYHKNQNHIMVNGGTFNADVNHQFWANEVFVPETLALKDNDNGTWTVVEAAGYVVEIGVSQHSRERKVGYVDLAAFEGEDVLGNKDGEYFVTGAGSLKQFAEEVGGEVKLENSNIAMTEDITVAENKELLMESDSKIAFNGGGNTITANGTGTKAGESYDYGYVGFIPANKEAATVENVTVTGSGFVEVGHHGTSMGGDYTINNLTVKDLIATLAINNGGNNIAAAFSHYGNAEMTDCVMTGTTTLKEGFKAYDAAFVNTTKTVMSGCTFGKIYLANQAHVTITNSVIDVIDSYAISTRNLGKLVIGAGAEIGVINLYDTGSYKATLVIEEGANVGAIVYNGVTYTAAEWMAR